MHVKLIITIPKEVVIKVLDVFRLEVRLEVWRQGSQIVRLCWFFFNCKITEDVIVMYYLVVRCQK